MPNLLDATGLQVATTAENAADLTAALQAIYGTGINLQSESPDGQWVGIFAQAESDIGDLQIDVYNTFSVSSAYGLSLQRLVEVNGLAIKGGTFTTTPVNVTASAAGTLPGLDQTAVPPFQVQDPNTVWTLISSYAFGAPGTQALVFQAATLGPITPLVNTINVQATPFNFISGVNNPTVTGTVLGQAYETDAALRQRQAQSFALAATCPADAVEGQLLNLADVSDAIVSENRGTVIGPFPINTLWCVVVGGTPAEIAQVIYAKAAPGVGLFGAQTYTLVRPNGQPATMKWDTGVAQQLYAEFGIVPAVAGLTFNKPLIIQQLAAALVAPYFRLGRPASIGDLVRAMFAIAPQAIVVSPGVSLTNGSGYTDQVSPTSAEYFFTIPAANIVIT